MAARGASESKRMRSTDSSALVPVVHRFANAAGAPAERTTATGNCRRYCGENAPTEKRFSPVDLLASQVADIRCSTGMSASIPCGGTTSNVGPSRRARRAAAEHGRGERRPRLLADLERREAEIHVQRQPLGAHLVEHGLAAMVVGDLAQSPHELLG